MCVYICEIFSVANDMCRIRIKKNLKKIKNRKKVDCSHNQETHYYYLFAPE